MRVLETQRIALPDSGNPGVGYGVSLHNDLKLPPRRVLSIDRRHVRVALARGNSEGENCVKCLQVTFAQGDLCGGNIFREAFNASRPRNGYDVVALRTQPGQCYLGRRSTKLGGEFGDFLNEVEILGEVLTREAGMPSTGIIGREVFYGVELARQKATTERAVSDKPDS